MTAATSSTHPRRMWRLSRSPPGFGNPVGRDFSILIVAGFHMVDALHGLIPAQAAEFIARGSAAPRAPRQATRPCALRHGPQVRDRPRASRRTRPQEVPPLAKGTSCVPDRIRHQPLANLVRRDAAESSRSRQSAAAKASISSRTAGADLRLRVSLRARTGALPQPFTHSPQHLKLGHEHGGSRHRSRIQRALRVSPRNLVFVRFAAQKRSIRIPLHRNPPSS